MKIKTNQLVFVLAILCVGLAGSTYAQQPVIPLYPGVAPGSENAKRKEVSFVNPDKQTCCVKSCATVARVEAA